MLAILLTQEYIGNISNIAKIARYPDLADLARYVIAYLDLPDLTSASLPLVVAAVPVRVTMIVIVVDGVALLSLVVWHYDFFDNL